MSPVFAAVDPYKVDWSIQIDSQAKAVCTISYDLGKYSFDLREDKTLSRRAGACLSLSLDKYWLNVAKTKECVEKVYNITCDNDFIVSLFYISQGIYNVPADIFSSSYNNTVSVDIIETTPSVVPTNDCQEVYDYTCRSSCFDTEEEVNYPCISGVCCKPQGVSISCTEVSDCLKRDCNAEYVKDENGKTGRCEYASELNCNDDFDNDGDGRIDMSDTDCSQTCEDKFGLICAGDETCSGDIVRAFDTDECCINGDCQKIATCAEQNGFKCALGQECDDWIDASDGLCCSVKCKSKTSIMPFVIIAIILALGAAAFFLYKKGFFKKGLAIGKRVTPPALPPQTTQYRPPVRPLQPQPRVTQPVNVNIKFQPHQIPRREKSELDETLKKLRKLAEK